MSSLVSSDPIAAPSAASAGANGAAASAPPVWQNPYANHRALSAEEAELLGEYARLADTIRRITQISAPLSSPARHASLLTQLRVLERKMGLVLTLFKASVWALVVEQQDLAEEEERRREEEERRREEEERWEQQQAAQGDETARYEY